MKRFCIMKSGTGDEVLYTVYSRLFGIFGFWCGPWVEYFLKGYCQTFEDCEKAIALVYANEKYEKEFRKKQKEKQKEFKKKHKKRQIVGEY